MAAQSEAAQSMAERNDAALAAYQAQDIAAALRFTDEVIAEGPEAGRADPDAYLTALNNRTFLRMTRQDPGARDAAVTAWHFAQTVSVDGSVAWLTSLNNLAQMETAIGNRDAARTARERMLAATRGSPRHAQILSAAIPLAFANEDFTDLRTLVDEQIDIAGRYLAPVDLDTLYARQGQAEAEQDIAAVTALAYTRIAIASVLVPEQADSIAHSFLWPVFYANYTAGNYGDAADALRIWATTGTPTDEERAFIRSQAENALLLTQGEAFADRAGGQLGFAQLTLAFAQLAYDPNNYRIGLAWRELAYAQSELAQYDAARDSLQTALRILQSSAAGLPHLFLVLEDLAANARLQGALDDAERLYDRAEDEYRTRGDKAGVALSASDLSIRALNRARLALDLGHIGEAEMRLGAADTLVAAHMSGNSAKPNDARILADIQETRALLLAAKGDRTAALQSVRETAALTRAAFPEGHPDRLRLLLNASDAALALNDRGLGNALLDEVWEAAQTGLPVGDSIRTETQLKLAVAALLDGQLPVATQQLQQVADARKSALYRAELAAHGSDFEMLAWALLARDHAARADVNAALTALQWTQVSRSADALAMTQTRLASRDGHIARQLRVRQNLADQMIRSRSDLTAAYSDGSDPAPVLARQARLADDLAKADAALAGSGVSLIGAGPVQPVDLKRIQSLLGPDDIVVTFLLPGLIPDLLPDLDTSANKAIAIWHDGYRIGPIREPSRAVLRKRVTAFRCQMALGDPACATAALAELRGGMEEDNADVDGPSTQSDLSAFSFDPALAHRLFLDLFGGIASSLQGRARLIIVPPPDLLRLPFSALVTDMSDPDNPHWMIRDHAISVIPSLPALASLRAHADRPSEPLSFLGIGDPDIGTGPDVQCDQTKRLASRRAAAGSGAALYQPVWKNGLRLADPNVLKHFARLPDASCELRAIQAVAGPAHSTVITRKAASESRVKTLSATGILAKQDIVVFATHGLISGEASAVAPGLLLSPPDVATAEDDGLLTSAEVALLDLNADLVILSACNTASGEDGDDEGLSGLASSFFHAGARRLIVTHWSVYSAASAEISARVAGQFAAGGTRDAAVALRRSVLSMLDDPDRPPLVRHPSYWAAFAVVGG